jgi:hypothetical protein
LVNVTESMHMLILSSVLSQAARQSTSRMEEVTPLLVATIQQIPWSRFRSMNSGYIDWTHDILAYSELLRPFSTVISTGTYRP